MNTRTLTTEVVFRRPFLLGGLDGVQSPGTYRIETYSELVDVPSAVAYRRLSTSIELHDQPVGTTRTATIDPAELDEALRLDAAPEAAPVIAPVIASKPANTKMASTGAPTAPAPAAAKHAEVEWHHHVAGGRERRSPWSQWLSLNTNELVWIALVFGGLLLVGAVL